MIKLQRLLLNTFTKHNPLKTKYQQFGLYKIKNNLNYEKNRVVKKIAIGVGVTVIGVSAYCFLDKAYAAQKENSFEAGIVISDLPYYSIDDVEKHNNKDDGIWVVYKHGVYDITSFVDIHPGGKEIFLAAGGSLEPFWSIYTVHNSKEIFELLEEYRIGNIKSDEQFVKKHVSDPFANDPRRHPALKPVSQKPFNAECPPNLLVEQFVTPNELFFVRNHLPVPVIDPAKYKLEIEIEGVKKRTILNLEQLKKFPKHTVVSTIMCAGNRRSEMMKVKPVKGLEWGPAAVGNAVWTGVKLRDVLLSLGIDNIKKFKHVQFEGYDCDVSGQHYGASIPLWKAIDERCETILAYEMNGEPLPRDHGFPVRVVVPGVVGARNVKWLSKIVVAEHESNSHWQQNDYKGFNPSVDWDTVDFKKSPAIQEMPVISAICSPRANDSVQVHDGYVTVKGYAWSGGGQSIVRVDITADHGKTWHTASLDHQSPEPAPQHFAWTLWSARIPVKATDKEVEIWAKAVDSSYNTQPESFENIWNLRGVLNNAYHRIRLKLEHK